MNLTTIPFTFALVAASAVMASAQESLTTSGATDASTTPQERAKERGQAGKVKAPSKGLRRAFLPHSTVIGHAVTAGEGVAMGTVQDLVLDPATGTLSHVVIKAGENSAVAGQMRAVPFKSLSWKAAVNGDTTASLTLEPRAFEALQAFDPAKLDALAGSKAIDAAAKRVEKAAKDMTDEAKAALGQSAREATATAARSVLLSGLAGASVHAPTGDAFASVGEAVIDCGRGTVAFATVGAADAQYLVPFPLLELKSEPTRDPAAPVKLSVTAPMDATALADAPKVEGKLTRLISQPRYRASVYKHYGVEAPAGRADRGDKGQGPKAAPGKEQAVNPKKAKTRKVKTDDADPR